MEELGEDDLKRAPRLVCRLEENRLHKASVKGSQTYKKKKKKVTSFRWKRFVPFGKLSHAPYYHRKRRRIDCGFNDEDLKKKIRDESWKAETLSNDIKPIQKLSLPTLNFNYNMSKTKIIKLLNRRRKYKCALKDIIQSDVGHTNAEKFKLMPRGVGSSHGNSFTNNRSPFTEFLNLQVVSHRNILWDTSKVKMINIGKGTFGSVFFCQPKCFSSEVKPEVSSLKQARGYEEQCENYWCVKRVVKRQESWIIMRKQVEREIQIHSRLDHFAIIQFLGCYESEKSIDLAIKFAIYGDLFHFLNTRRPQDGLRVLLSHREASNCIEQILQAMNYLHHRCVFHRDIKMENILVSSIDEGTNQGEQKLHLKLCDFGWAIHCRDPDELWRTTFCGTPAYLAPELVECDPAIRTQVAAEDQSILLKSHDNFRRLRSKCAKYDVRFPDIWAVGVLTIELIRGANPFSSHFTGEDNKETKKDDQNTSTSTRELIFEKIRKVDDFITVRTLQDCIEERLMCDFVANLTRKEPDQRMSFEKALEQKWITYFK